MHTKYKFTKRYRDSKVFISDELHFHLDFKVNLFNLLLIGFENIFIRC